VFNDLLFSCCKSGGKNQGANPVRDLFPELKIAIETDPSYQPEFILSEVKDFAPARPLIFATLCAEQDDSERVSNSKKLSLQS